MSLDWLLLRLSSALLVHYLRSFWLIHSALQGFVVDFLSTFIRFSESYLGVRRESSPIVPTSTVAHACRSRSILTTVSSGWCLCCRLENRSCTHRACQASHSKSGKHIYPVSIALRRIRTIHTSHIYDLLYTQLEIRRFCCYQVHPSSFIGAGEFHSQSFLHLI